MRKLKTPNGKLIKEIKATIEATFTDGVADDYLSDLEDADETGRFCFEFEYGKITKWYTHKTAPAWLRAYYYEEY